MVRVVTEAREFESLKGIWDSLSQKCRDDNSVYLTHEWLSTCWQHLGQGKKLNILLIEKGRRVIGIIPLVKTEYRIGLIKLDALEPISQTSCNYVGLVLPEYREEAVSGLLTYLEKELAKNRVILLLPLVPEDSRFLGVLRRHAAAWSRNLVIQERVMTLAPYIPLPPTWDEYFSSLSSKRRQLLRRALRELEQAHTVRFQRFNVNSLERGLSKFFDLHQRRWQSKGITSQFSNPRTKGFYRDISRKFLKRSWLHFSCLTVDDEVVSAIYGTIHNRKFYSMFNARDTRYYDYDVGHLHYMFLIEDAIERRLKEFDFLRGDEPYKFYWTKSARRYMQVLIIKKGFLPGLRLKFINVFLRLYWIRQRSLKENYSLYLLQRREEKAKKGTG